LPVSVVSTSTANNGLTGTPATVTVAAPTAIASGNLLIAFTTSDGASTFSAPSGWTLYELIPAVSNSPSFTIFWKIATGSEPSTYSFVASPVEALIVSILNISGASIVSPFNGYFTKYPSASLATAGSTSGIQSIPTYIGCLPIALFAIQQLNPSNTGSPTGLTSGWTGRFLAVVQDTSNYSNYSNNNGYSATFVASGPLTTSTSTAVTASCTWGGSNSTFIGLSVLLFINPIESSYGTLTAYPSAVDLIGSGLSDGMQLSIVETNFTGSFSVTVPTPYQSIVSVCATQGGTYGTSCSVSGPSNSFWIQGIAPGAFQIDVSGG